MEKVYVIDTVRTAVGKYGGALRNMRPDDLLATAIKGLLDRNPTIDVAAIEDVIAGAANQSGEDNRNVARMAALLAGLPPSVPGNTVNRLCASGLQAIMDSARQIAVGDAELMIACGVESMTRAPFVMGKSDAAFGRTAEVYDTTIGWRFTNKKLSERYFPYSMGETAENVAKQWNVSRAEQDEFAYNSQKKYEAAHQSKRFAEEIIPIQIKGSEEIFSF
jgi:acetyl-CoA C-acetyltransferase